jgi:hypothetical protein
MKGLLVRDLLVLIKKVSVIRLVALAVAGILLTFLMRLAGSSLLSVVLPMMAVGSMSVLAAEDDKTNWQKFVRASPASAWEAVCARYLVCGAVLLLSGTYTFLLNLGCCLLFSEQPLRIYLILSGVGMIAACINALAMIPSCFSRGASGANFMGTVFLFLAGGLAWLLRQVDVTWLTTYLADIPVHVSVLGGMAVMVLATVLSIVVSVRVFRDKTIY